MSKIIEQLNWRYAAKAFDSSKKLSQEQLNTLLEALRLSASSFGLQPWKFVVVENQDLKDKLVTASWNQAQVAQASQVIVLCNPVRFGESDVDKYLDDMIATRGGSRADLEGYEKMMKGFLAKFDDEQKFQWMKGQIYLALGNLLTVCAVEGIDSCPMEGFVAQQYNEILGLSERGLNAAVVCPVGFRGDADKYATQPKVRYPLSEVVIKL